ncbi:uncharacterized protein LOC133160414 [Syngnathus typhle]|uniref:uncharacterized protein LOC133160414 n=1 Tax=Syngnathus typhle TaxID=161592 RepID=UPI002A699879|nr:uncharacterized protein LOC133160414 [Syngnathus typhle]
MSTKPYGSRYSDKPKEKENEQPQEEAETPLNDATTNRVVQNTANTHTSTIIPVWLSSVSKPKREVLVYALLDTQSDTTFVLEEAVKALNTKSAPVQLKLSTLALRNIVVSCQKLTGLQVRGFYSDKLIPLPVTYSREFIPANRDHIPTPETAKAWPHLEHIADEIAPLQSCDVGLLIGYNCAQALIPRQVVPGEEHQPFAQRTDLGWSVVGYGKPRLNYGDAIGMSHQVIAKQVMPGLPSSSDLTSEVHYVYRTQIKKVILPADVMKMLESDFIERSSEASSLSQEDIKFLSEMETGIKLKSDGHYEMPRPFKRERPNLPDNKICAIQRLKCLERKMKGNHQYYKDHKTFMDETISRGDAEMVPEEDNPADHASRGLTAEQLLSSNWFTGPDRFWQKELPSGEVKVGEIASDDPELKKVQVLDTQAKEVRSVLNRLHKFSVWSRMVKAIARLKRHVKEVKGLQPRSCEATSLEERREAELTIIEMVQEAAFSQEIPLLQSHKETLVKGKANLYLHKRWRRVPLLANHFWTRWKKEYLLNLQQRQK